MKQSLIFSLLVFLISSSFCLDAQLCALDPSIRSGWMGLPLAPIGTSTFDLNVEEDFLDHTDYQNDPYEITICMLNISPAEGLASVGGDFNHVFNWQYDPVSNCLLGTQNQPILAGGGYGVSYGRIRITYKVDNVVHCPGQMGYNAVLYPPDCTIGNQTYNDVASEYRCFTASFTCKGRIAAKTSDFYTYRFGFRGPQGVLPYFSYLWSFGDGDHAYGPSQVHTYSQPGIYPVTLQVNNYGAKCGYGRYVKVDNNNVIEDIEGTAFKFDLGTGDELNQLELHPNPANDQVAVKIENESLGDVALSIMNVAGQTVFSSQIQVTEGKETVNLDLSKYDSGVYFVVMKSSNVVVTKKLVKN